MGVRRLLASPGERRRALEATLAAAHPAIPLPCDVVDTADGPGLVFPPRGGAGWAQILGGEGVAGVLGEDGALGAARVLLEGVATLHAVGWTLGMDAAGLVAALRIGGPDDPAPIWLSDPGNGTGTAADDWRALGALLDGAGIDDDGLDAMEAGSAPTGLRTWPFAAPPELAGGAGWLRGALSGRQSPAVIPDRPGASAAAACFALRAAADEGIRVVVVRPGAGDAVAAWRRAIGARLPRDAAVVCGVEMRAGAQFEALTEAYPEPVLVVFDGATDDRDGSLRALLAPLDRPTGRRRPRVAVLCVGEPPLDHTLRLTPEPPVALAEAPPAGTRDEIEHAARVGALRWVRVASRWVRDPLMPGIPPDTGLGDGADPDRAGPAEDDALRLLLAGRRAEAIRACMAIPRHPVAAGERALALRLLGNEPEAVTRLADDALVRADLLGRSLYWSLVGLRVALYMDAQALPEGFALAERVLLREPDASADPALESAWRTVLTAMVEHQVEPPDADRRDALLDAAAEHRGPADAAQHAVLLDAVIHLLLACADPERAQAALDAEAGWLAAQHHAGVTPWLTERVEAAGLRWPNAPEDTRGAAALLESAAEFAAATTRDDLARAVAASLSRLTGRVVTPAHGPDPTARALLGTDDFAFAQLRDADLSGFEPLLPVVGRALDRIRHAEEHGRRAHRLHSALLAAAEGGAEQGLSALVGTVAEQVGAARGQIAICDEQGRVATTVGSLNGHSATLVSVAARQPRSVVIPDALEDDRLAASGSTLHLGLRGVLLGALQHEGRLLGAILLEGERFLPSAAADLDGLLPTIAGAVRAWADRLRPAEPLAALPDAVHPMGFVAGAPAMLPVVDMLTRTAPLDVPVLLTGETGCGKEVLARALHAHGGRSDGPFVAINCGALPATILEGELFGYRKGAFTGANRDNPGLIRSADGGVLFLDEVGEMGAEVQKRLLRVLQEAEVQPLGGGRAVRIDVRVVAATHVDLREAVEAGRFREDLYYRLRVIEIPIPPLRDRREDIPPLARRLLERASERLRCATPALTRGALQALMRHRWPGNVRELEHALVRATVLAGDAPIAAAHLDLTPDPRADPTVAVSPADRSDALLAFVAERGRIKRGDWVAASGVSPATALRDLRALVGEGRLIREGERRGATYRVASSQPASA
jgi:transcriptional regulator with AAA-type ATPase domain